MSESNESSGGGCGCVSLIVFILIMWALFFGLPIGSHRWNIDIFPPRIWDMNDMPSPDTPTAAPTPTPAQDASPAVSPSSDSEVAEPVTEGTE